MPDKIHACLRIVTTVVAVPSYTIQLWFSMQAPYSASTAALCVRIVIGQSASKVNSPSHATFHG